MIKNVVFDVGNVLAGYAPLEFLARRIPNPAARQVVNVVYFEAPEWPLTDAGQVGNEELIALAISRAPQYKREIRFAGEHWFLSLPRIEGMLELARELNERGHGLYVISNFSSRFHEMKVLPEYAVLFGMMDGIVISSDIKMVKPDREIYEYFLSRYRLEAAECLFIDDMPANIAGAAAVGIQGHLFKGAPDLRERLGAERLL